LVLLFGYSVDSISLLWQFKKRSLTRAATNEHNERHKEKYTK